ncbi:MAG TPA: glycosyltransferase family 4 protein [Chthoniobacterales bacterium]
MTIVLVNDSCSVNGGTAAVAIEEAVGLSNAGFAVHFFGVTGPVDARLATAGVQVHCSDRPSFLDDPDRLGAAARGWWNFEEAARFRQLLRALDPKTSIVHIHGWMKALSPAIFHTAWTAGFRVVTTLHDYFLSCPNGAFLEHPTRRICTRKPLSRSCISCNCDPRSRGQKFWRVGRGFVQEYIARAAERTSGFLAVSKFSLEKLRDKIPAECPVDVVQNPLNLAPPEKPAGDPGGPLLFVGRLSPEKGAMIFAEAVAETGRSAVILGDGPQGDRLRESYPQLDFRGWVDPAEVRRWMTVASGLVFPSIWYETNGLVVAEAMAHGLPVYVSEGTAACEFVRDGVTGFRFPMGSVAGLVERLQSSRDMAFEVGRRAFDWYWAEPWTTESHVTRIIDFYRRILNE